MIIVPLRDRILVRRIAAETMTASGLHIPDTAKEKPIQGDVVAVGEGTQDVQGIIHPLIVRVGDRVLFGKYAGTDLELEGVPHLLMREDDVLGLVVPPMVKPDVVPDVPPTVFEQEALQQAESIPTVDSLYFPENT